MVEIRYRGFLTLICRQFDTRERAVQWLRQIGRADLIDYIKDIEMCIYCEEEFYPIMDNLIEAGAVCFECLHGLADDYYAFSLGDTPND